MSFELVDAIKKRIFELCEQKNLSINKLAMNCGMTQSSLNNIINGSSLDPKISTIKKICDGLNIKLSEFFNCDYFNNLEQEIK